MHTENNITDDDKRIAWLEANGPKCLIALPTCTRRLELANISCRDIQDIEGGTKGNLTVDFCAIEEGTESGDGGKNNLRIRKSWGYENPAHFCCLTSVCALGFHGGPLNARRSKQGHNSEHMWRLSTHGCFTSEIHCCR